MSKDCNYDYHAFIWLWLVTEPLPPGPVSDILSNYSADNLYLRWNASEFDSFVNRYKVSIDGHDQTTDGNEPEIHWNELLEPHKPYNVSIIAISFGYTVNYPLNGSRESRPSVKQIVTEDSKYKFTILYHLNCLIINILRVLISSFSIRYQFTP